MHAKSRKQPTQSLTQREILSSMPLDFMKMTTGHEMTEQASREQLRSEPKTTKELDLRVEAAEMAAVLVGPGGHLQDFWKLSVEQQAWWLAWLCDEGMAERACALLERMPDHDAWYCCQYRDNQLKERYDEPTEEQYQKEGNLKQTSCPVA